MKDRNAWTDNKISRGVDPTEAKTQRAFGVPAGAHVGLVEAAPQFKGLPEGEAKGLVGKNYSLIPPKPKPKACSATTKKGLPCKAAPTESGVCIGHSRIDSGPDTSTN